MPLQNPLDYLFIYLNWNSVWIILFNHFVNAGEREKKNTEKVTKFTVSSSKHTQHTDYHPNQFQDSISIEHKTI